MGPEQKFVTPKMGLIDQSIDHGQRLNSALQAAFAQAVNLTLQSRLWAQKSQLNYPTFSKSAPVPV
jgi:hypothetical protein